MLRANDEAPCYPKRLLGNIYLQSLKTVQQLNSVNKEGGLSFPNFPMNAICFRWDV